MKCRFICVMTVVILGSIQFNSALAGDAASPKQFTPLVKVQPRIIASSIAYPGGRYEATNLIDGNIRTEYSSEAKGTETFIVFDFGRPLPIAGLRHVDRNDPATVAKSRLTFGNVADVKDALETIDVEHANTRGGVTCIAFPPFTARYARWQVTAVGPQRYSTVGGAEIAFFAAETPEPFPKRIDVKCHDVEAVLRNDDGLTQPIEVTVSYRYAEPVDATVRVADSPAVPVKLSLGSHSVPVPPVPAVESETEIDVVVELAGQTVKKSLVLHPVRQWELWFLPHSHNDIGYTHVQTEVERKQWQYLDDAVALARRTADYPPGAQFKWNGEVMWAVDSYLRRATPEKKAEFIDAVRRGWIGLDALYGNELTALCRDEELFRLTDCARRVAKQYDLTIDTAMISDVPGYTWGIVPVLAHSGVKYFSIGPNHIHRIGYTLADWGDRPFYWVSPSGQERILCWMAGHAYSWFHPGLMGSIKHAKPKAFFEYLDQLTAADYEYDMVQVRYSIDGDNGPPDPDLPEFVREWNEKYAWPKMTIATTSELMREFEQRYGDRLPEARGDFTPYWEDGAASSARETALTRNASERLIQAEALWAMLEPNGYPDAEFYAAWRNVILYNEHTWGAHCSISQPDSQFTLDQWRIKQKFAADADQQSKELLDTAANRKGSEVKDATAVDVYNTCSWPRTELVILSDKISAAGDAVKTTGGETVPSQRLECGALAFLAANVPSFGAKRFFLSPGEVTTTGSAAAEGSSLKNGKIRVQVDEKTGAIAQFVCQDNDINLAGDGLNTYWYVAGRNPKDPKPNEPAKITIGERGPLVASLVVESDAPGCRKLVRRLRVVDGLSGVQLTNVVDKEPVLSPESVHFGFAANIPDGVMRMDMPWAIVRPEQDQLPGACKNYFTAGRWVDVSNDDIGLTCAVVDAPLVEVGSINVDVASPYQTDAWIRHLKPTQTFYSYVMNNYWETNYKASQEGPTMFRYSLRPHGPFDPVAAAKFGIEQARPLVVVPADPRTPIRGSMLRVEPDEVIVTSLKPSMDGRALMVRLMNLGDDPAAARVIWAAPQPSRIVLSSPFEDPGEPVDGQLELQPRGIITLRAELDR